MAKQSMSAKRHVDIGSSWAEEPDVPIPLNIGMWLPEYAPDVEKYPPVRAEAANVRTAASTVPIIAHCFRYGIRAILTSGYCNIRHIIHVYVPTSI